MIPSAAIASLLLSISAGVSTPKIAPPRFSLTLLEGLPGMTSQGMALNGRGECVTRLTNGFELVAAFHGTPDAPPVIATGEGSTFAHPTDINTAGLVVGSAGEGLAAFRWIPGNDIEWLPTQGPCCPFAEAVNDFGAIAGVSVFGGGPSVATLWQGGGAPRNLGSVPGDLGSVVHDIDESGVMVGVSGNLAARWTRGGVARLELPGAQFSYAHGVNGSGDVVGEAYLGGPGQAVLWSGGSAVVLPTLGGIFAGARSINDHGWIVGTSAVPLHPNEPNSRAALWIGGVAHDLNERTIDLPPGVWLLSAADVNDAGQIVGNAIVDGFDQAFFLDPVPVLTWKKVDPSVLGPLESFSSSGAPLLAGEGALDPGEFVSFALSGAPPSSPAWLVLGSTRVDALVAGQRLVPAPEHVLGGFMTDAHGELQIAATWPSEVSIGARVFAQVFVADPTAMRGLTASNAISAASGHE